MSPPYYLKAFFGRSPWLHGQPVIFLTTIMIYIITLLFIIGIITLFLGITETKLFLCTVY